MSVTAPAFDFDKVQAPSVSEAVAAFRGRRAGVRDPAGDSLSVALDLRFSALSLSHGRCHP